MNDALRMEIDEAFEDLVDVTGDESFRKLAELLQSPLQRAVLDESAELGDKHSDGGFR